MELNFLLDLVRGVLDINKVSMVDVTVMLPSKGARSEGKSSKR